MFFVTDTSPPLIVEGVYMCSCFLACPRLFWLQERAHCLRGAAALTRVQEMDWMGGTGPGTQADDPTQPPMCVFAAPLDTRR